MMRAGRRISAGAWILAAAVGLVGPASAFAFGSPSDSRIAAPGDGPAVTNADAEVIILYASNDKSGIDPAIGEMPELGKPPFSSFNSYKLVDKKTIQLAKGSASKVTLPTNSTLSITFKDVIVTKPKDATQKPETRYVVTESVVNGDKNVLPDLEVNAKRGEFFFIAGEKYKDGALVIGTRIK